MRATIQCVEYRPRGMQPAPGSSIHKFIPAAFLLPASFYRLTICRCDQFNGALPRTLKIDRVSWARSHSLVLPTHKCSRDRVDSLFFGDLVSIHPLDFFISVRSSKVMRFIFWGKKCFVKRFVLATSSLVSICLDTELFNVALEQLIFDRNDVFVRLVHCVYLFQVTLHLLRLCFYVLKIVHYVILNYIETLSSHYVIKRQLKCSPSILPYNNVFRIILNLTIWLQSAEYTN